MHATFHLLYLSLSLSCSAFLSLIFIFFPLCGLLSLHHVCLAHVLFFCMHAGNYRKLLMKVLESSREWCHDFHERQRALIAAGKTASSYHILSTHTTTHYMVDNPENPQALYQPPAASPLYPPAPVAHPVILQPPAQMQAPYPHAAPPQPQQVEVAQDEETGEHLQLHRANLDEDSAL